MPETLITRRTSARAFPANCEFGLRVSRRFSEFNAEASPQGAWRLRVDVLVGYQVDPNVFLYQRKTDPSEGVDQEDVFVGVCSPVDIEDYPAGAPSVDPGDDTGFYRMADIDIMTRNRNKLDRLWEDILLDLTELITTMTNICELEDPVVLEIGDLGSSSSSSSVPRTLLRTAPRALPVVPTQAMAMPRLILVETSDDEGLPVGVTFTNTGGSVDPVTLYWCAREASEFELRVYPESHQVKLSGVVGGVQTTAGISHGYRAIFNYRREGVAHCVQIVGEW